MDFSDSALYDFDFDKIGSAIWGIISGIDWWGILVKLSRHLLIGWVKFSPMGMIVNITLKSVEAMINEIIHLINKINIPVPEWLRELLGIETETIGFDIPDVDLDTGKIVYNLFDKIEKITGVKKEEIGDYGEIVGKEFADGVSNGVSESTAGGQISTGIEETANKMDIFKSKLSEVVPVIEKGREEAGKFLDLAGNQVQSKLSEAAEAVESHGESVGKFLGLIKSDVQTKLSEAAEAAKKHGGETGEGYANGVKNGQTEAANFLGLIYSDVQTKLGEAAKDAGISGENTGNNYANGINSKQSFISTIINQIHSTVQTGLDQSENSDNWGQDTTEEYAGGFDNRKSWVQIAVDNIKSTVQTGLNQSNNSDNWGQDTTQEYAGGIESKQSWIQTAIDKVKSTVQTGLNQGNNSSSWGSSTITNYESGLQSQSGSLTGVVNSVQSVIKNSLSNYNVSYNWGSDMIKGFRDGMDNTAYSESGLIGVIRKISNLIRSYFHFSRPDVGPLREYETWMPDMVDGLSKSLLKSLPQLNNTMAYASKNLMKEFTDNTLVDSNVTSNVIWSIANKTSSANKDNATSNMATATYSAVSRALADNKSDSMQKIIVNVGNKTVYEGFGTFRDEESKRLGVNT